MFWALAGFLDIYVETPQLRMLWSSDKLDGWTIAYYCSVGVQIFSYVLGSIYGFVRDWYKSSATHLHSFHPPRIWRYDGVFDTTTLCTTICKGVVIAAFLVARYFRGWPTDIREKGLPGPDDLYVYISPYFRPDREQEL